MPLSTPADAGLPPAVPPYEPDVEKLHAQIGRLTVWVTELTNTLQRRAVETNTLHDQYVASQRELAAARARIAELERDSTGGGT